jgi:methyl-accepting chemotaxis protein
VKDVIASYEVLVNLFERIQLFLQRLNHYATISFTSEMIQLLGKIMALVISVLALSTKAMKERRISESCCLLSSVTADHGAETFIKRLAGKKDVEDALERLDMLTKEENLMAAARNLEVTHHVDVTVKATQELTHRVDVNVKATQEVTHRVEDKVTRVEEVVHGVNDNVKATKELTHDIHENVSAIKEDTRSVHDNVKVTRYGA